MSTGTGPHTEKRPKKIIHPEEMVSFKWGGNTQEWEEEADQIMHTLQDQLDNQQSDEEIQNIIDYGMFDDYYY